MSHTSRLAVAVAATLLTVGCAPLQQRELPQHMSDVPDDVKGRYEKQWNEPPMVVEGRTMIVLTTPMTPPKALQQREIKLELEDGATIRDVSAVLANLGYSIMIADKETAEKEVYLPRYRGTLGGLLANLQRAADVWFSWEDNAIVVSSKERITVSMPQDEKLSEKIEKSLGTLKIEGVHVSWAAGIVTAELKPSQLKQVRDFLEQIMSNAAIVNLQVAVVSVQLNQDSKAGFDWSKMQLAIGGDNTNLLGGLDNSTDGTTVPGTGTGGTTGGTTTGPTANTDPGEGLFFNAGLLRAVVSNDQFTLVSFMDYLETHGTSQVLQNVMLRTSTGNEVQLKSVTQIPYVENIGVGSSGISGDLLGSARTATANDGITLKMTPTFNALNSSVTINMDLAIESVLGFVELSAGNQLGTLTQPNRAERTFNDVIRIRPGQTVVVGGLIYDSVTRNNNVPLFMPDKAGWQNLVVKRTSTFIVIRPTVTVLGVIKGDTAQLFEQARDNPATHSQASVPRSLPVPTATAGSANPEPATVTPTGEGA
jgi:type II secretory pathway component GspD/PulD (secretin)